jgi:phenylpropionate dioxygenase-like ring-hydroxylating dioxygenase large terminal subunit
MLPPVSGPIIPPKLYSDEVNFKRELKEIFQDNWVFAGFADGLAKNKDFITLDLGDANVVVQNFQGQIKAFLNVCSHRFSKIQCKKSGNRPLSCPYHSWTFDENGIPKHIPKNDEYFKFSDEDKKELALREVSLEICGNFVFISYNKPAITLQEYLGDYYDVLDHLSGNFTNFVTSAELPWQANWKIGVESVLEVYHVNAVHPTSFVPFTKERWDIEYHQDHSRGIAYLSDKSERWWTGVAKKMGLNQSEKYKNYDHFFIYPNLAIGCTGGYLMSVQTYDPVAPENCILNYRLYLAKSHKKDKLEGAVYNAVAKNFMEFNSQVLEEDKVISENVQKGTRVAERQAVPGINEGRIYHFHKAYMSGLGEK